LFSFSPLSVPTIEFPARFGVFFMISHFSKFFEPPVKRVPLAHAGVCIWGVCLIYVKFTFSFFFLVKDRFPEIVLSFF